MADLEVQTLLQRARSIVMSLTSEVEKRKLKITEHWEVILQENFDRLLVVQELNEQDIKLLRFAHDLNEKPREKWTTQNTIYSEFLKVVGRYCNHGFALLCVLAFSQRFIVRMAKNDRINLYKFIETSNGSFSSPRLDTLAIQHDILKLFGLSLSEMRILQCTVLTYTSEFWNAEDSSHFAYRLRRAVYPNLGACNQKLHPDATGQIRHIHFSAIRCYDLTIANTS